MALTYFKRFRMEIELARQPIEPPALPARYYWLPWEPALVDQHAEVKYQSFCHEIDSDVFSCLGDPFGCQQLMREIVAKPGFLPEATWLIAYRGREGVQYCGTIQAVGERRSTGAVQNLGVVPEHRGQGLGRALLTKALEGFRQCGLRRVYLEVTAGNHAAIGLYRSVGFGKSRTVYKAVEAAALS